MPDIKAGSRTKSDFMDRLRLSGGLISAIDGLWFLAVEEASGTVEAMRLDMKVRERYVHILVKRMRRDLGFSLSGIDGIRQVIEADPVFLANEYEISHLSRDRMFVRINQCPLLEAMERAGRTNYVCETTTALYFQNVAREIEPNVAVHAIKLPPRGSPDEAACEWLFEVRGS